MRNEPDKRSYLLLIPSWIISGFFLFIFLKNSGWLPNTPVTIYDLAYLIVFLVFFVLPFISSLELGKLVGIKFRPTQASEGKVQEKPELEEKLKAKKPRTAIELKILNTLWNRQVLKFPELDTFFTFRLNVASPEFLEFREAGNRLMGEGLISETDTGYFFLTRKGLDYCAEHYEEWFPKDMWFKYKPLDQTNLEKLLKNLGQD